MSRGLSATNITRIDNKNISTAVLAKLEFDEAAYVWSGTHEITYDGNTYVGVGNLGGIGQAREGEELAAHSLTLTLSGVMERYISYALDSGKYGDKVTIYEGYYKEFDGTLYDAPWIVWSGFYEYATAEVGAQNVVTIICQHDLADIEEKDGGRYSDEDQQNRFSGDVGLEFAAYMADTKLLWGGGPVRSNRNYVSPWKLP